MFLDRLQFAPKDDVLKYIKKYKLFSVSVLTFLRFETQMEGTVSSLCHPNQDLGSRRRSVRILLPENDMPARRIGEIYQTS